MTHIHRPASVAHRSLGLTVRPGRSGTRRRRQIAASSAIWAPCNARGVSVTHIGKAEPAPEARCGAGRRSVALKAVRRACFTPEASAPDRRRLRPKKSTHGPHAPPQVLVLLPRHGYPKAFFGIDE